MKQPNDKKIQLMIRVAMLCALVAVVTIAIVIPIPNISGAYVNAGDAVVYTAAFLLGGPWGAVAAGIGSALADLILGSALYAPATLLIKAAMAFVAGKLLAGQSGFMRRLLAVCASGLLMPAGYFLYECALYGVGAAWAGVVFNLIQYAGGAALGLLLIQALDRLQAPHEDRS
ncbi:MAG: ECF transporter S component [Christensenellaceae bacterium]|jgi:uncharacterized membrane protein|nr:ECF transporter S component [Christensenellaceae bacterium]